MRIFTVPARLGLSALLFFAGSAAAQQMWDGTWSGTTVQAKPISITVVSNRITTLSFGGQVVNGCTADFTTNSQFSGSQPLVSSNGSFSINSPSSAPGAVGYSISGTLRTDGGGSGPLSFNLNAIPGVPSCSGSVTTSWNVNRQGGPPPVTTQDFSVSIAPTGITLAPGGSQQVTFSSTGTNFSGPITILPPASSLTFTPPGFTISAGGSQAMTITAGPNAPASTSTANFSASATINGSLLTKIIPLSVTIAPPAPPPVSGIFVAVGSLPGSFGSFFKTSLQLHNPRSTPISGKLVFHPAGTSASDGDPVLAYTLNAGQTLEWADLLPAMNKSGLGSMDLIVLTGAAPIAVARIYNDAGAGGTTGMVIEQLAPSSALAAGDTGIILGPSDPSKFRMNIGVRTLADGATMQIIVRDKNGAQRNSISRSYGASFFEQTGASAFAGIDLLSSDSIAITINSGSALIYGAANDNITQDPTLQYAKKSF